MTNMNGFRDDGRPVDDVPLTSNELRSLVRGLVRYSNVMASALRTGLQPEHFNGRNESPLKCFIEIYEMLHRRHGGVVLGADRRTMEFAQIGRAADRILDAAMRFVDAHRPLHRQPLRRSAFAHEAVGVNLAEHSAPSRIDGCRVLGVAPR